MTPSGTEGYAEEAGRLVERYEALSFEEKHAPVLHLLPAAPASIGDIGAGTGADAAWLASRGHRVVAVEPTAPLREAGMALHAAQPIEWIDDSLPALARLHGREAAFDAVLLTAVWMHLDAAQRRRAMPAVAALLAPGGLLLMSLRHGPVPAGRRMFDVTAQETIALAREHGLRAVFEARNASLQPENIAASVAWTRLAFRA